MKSIVMTTALFLMAGQASGQQSTTNTDCDVNGQQVSCTSTTRTPPPPSGAALHGALESINKTLAANRARDEAKRDQNAQQAQQAQLSQEAIKELLAEEKKERENKDTVDFIYCRRNSKGSITDSEGTPKTCADVMEYTKAFCSVNPEVDRCNLAKSKLEVEKAFAALADAYGMNRGHAGNEEYFADKFTKLTKWGCMSFPDMTLPQKNGTLHPCPDAPEPAAMKN
jgi:hypothetical protein